MLDTDWLNSQDGREDQVYQTFVRNYGSKGFYSSLKNVHNAFFQCKRRNFEAEFLKNYTVNMLNTEWVNSRDGPEFKCIKPLSEIMDQRDFTVE